MLGKNNSFTDGFIAVEAVIIITFLSCFLLLGVVAIDLYHVHIMAQYSLTQVTLDAAKSINILEAFQLQDWAYELEKSSVEKFGEDLDEYVGTIRELLSGKETLSVDWKKMQGQQDDLWGKINNWLQNPELLMTEITDYVMQYYRSQARNYLGIEMLEAQLANYWKNIRINNPFIRLHPQFSLHRSNIFQENGMVDLVLDYQVELRIPFVLTTNWQRQIKASTRAWIELEKSEALNDFESIWLLRNYWQRGRYLIAAEKKSYPYEIKNIEGLHYAYSNEDVLYIVRVISFDPFRKTNDMSSLEKRLQEHCRILSGKLSEVEEILLETAEGEKLSWTLSQNNAKGKILLIIPENTESEKLAQMETVLQNLGRNFSVDFMIKAAYGDSKYDEE